LLELFEKEPDVDMILLDLKMPRMDGINAMKIIRESNTTVPVIAQTAYDRTYHREQCIEMGCDEYFVKPLRKKEIMETVKKYLNV
jgi:CheY-like chemotaxis protein